MAATHYKELLNYNKQFGKETKVGGKEMEGGEMLTLLVILGLFGLITWGVLHKSNGDNWWDSGEAVAAVMGGIALGIFLLVLVTSRVQNTVGNASLELDYPATIQNYEVFVNGTRSLLSETSSDAKFVNGSIERTQITTAVSERVIKLRDKVDSLNRVIVSKNLWAHEYILGGFLWTPPAPKHLKPYMLQ